MGLPNQYPLRVSCLGFLELFNAFLVGLVVGLPNQHSLRVGSLELFNAFLVGLVVGLPNQPPLRVSCLFVFVYRSIEVFYLFRWFSGRSTKFNPP